VTPIDSTEKVKPMLVHPLSGADPATLIRVIARNRPIEWRSAPSLAISMASAVGRLPFTAAELAATAWYKRKAPTRQPPIFIVGHWRSGTTHLYNLLSRSPRFGYVPPLATGMPWDMLLLARLLRPLLVRMLPEERYIDRIPVKEDSPQEDEAALANMQPISFYHGLYFPRHLERNFRQGVFLDETPPKDIRRWQRRFLHFVDKLNIRFQGRPLLIKNPVYTARVRMLRQLLPDARFVHIHRDPLHVFQSMQNFYDKLLAAMALQSYDPARINELILDAYPRMMDCLLNDTRELPSDRFVEFGYDVLDDRPLEAVEAVYDQLGIPGFAEDRPRFQAYLDSIKSYRKNRYDLPEDLRREVATRWRPYFERWGYAVP